MTLNLDIRQIIIPSILIETTIYHFNTLVICGISVTMVTRCYSAIPVIYAKQMPSLLSKHAQTEPVYKRKHSKQQDKIKRGCIH